VCLIWSCAAYMQILASCVVTPEGDREDMSMAWLPGAAAVTRFALPELQQSAVQGSQQRAARRALTRS
jgi:hypothetical protein